jgi:hypothetical protein
LFVRPQGLLSTLAVVDIGQQVVPTQNAALTVTLRETALT